MARPVSRPVTIADNTRDSLISLGIYRQEFEPIIEIYSQLNAKYILFMKELELEGFFDEDGNKKQKYIACEKLRMDILSYSNSLGLTPAGLKKLGEMEKARSSPANNILKLANGKK